MKISNEKVLSDKYFYRVSDLFKKKNWKTEYEENEISEFDRFCKRLAFLNNDAERDLVLELAENYLKVSLSEYETMLIKVWRMYFDDKNISMSNKERFCICPLLPEAYFGKEKSGTMMLYLCQSLLLRRFRIFDEEQIRICQSPKGLVNCEFEIGELVLIDDYIGTGETGVGCLTYILDNVKIDFEKVSIISLVSQEEGIKNLENMGVKVYTVERRKKGISDQHANINDVNEKKRIMEEIERRMNVDEKYKFGFGESEALVSMIKTPNNTFPVFWLENKTIKAPAPFPRKENIKMLG